MRNDLGLNELTHDELVEFVSDFHDKPEGVKRSFHYDAHVEELISRASSGKVLTRALILKALNDSDLSYDSVPEELYVIDGDTLMEKLGLGR